MTHFGLAPYEEDGLIHPTVARATLGATFYLADNTHWATSGALHAFDTFLHYAPRERLSLFNTSMINEWRPVTTAEGIASLRAALPATTPSSLGSYLRHGFRFEYVDDPGAPCTGFTYTEADSSRGTRCSTLEVTLPSHTDPAILLALVDALSKCGPYWCAIGGYTARWNWLRKRAAFDVIYRWCGRWLGLDVQDAEQMAWRARDGLPGTNWLNLIGKPWAARNSLDIEELNNRGSGNILARPAGEGILLQAGDTPSEADVNLLCHPPAYEEIAKTLAPHVIKDLDEYWGMFGGRKETNIWLTRWRDLSSWNERRV